MIVKLDHFPKVRGENKKYLSCHHPVNSQVLPSDPFGGFKWPFQGLSDLNLGDQRVTWKKLVYIIILFRFFFGEFLILSAPSFDRFSLTLKATICPFVRFTALSWNKNDECRWHRLPSPLGLGGRSGNSMVQFFGIGRNVSIFHHFSIFCPPLGLGEMEEKKKVHCLPLFAPWLSHFWCQNTKVSSEHYKWSGPTSQTLYPVQSQKNRIPTRWAPTFVLNGVMT